jgi:hypothetical protein
MASLQAVMIGPQKRYLRAYLLVWSAYLQKTGLIAARFWVQVFLAEGL